MCFYQGSEKNVVKVIRPIVQDGFVIYLHIDKPIANDACELVPPAPNNGAFVAEVIRMREAHASRDAGQVTQVEYVVELRWGGRQFNNHYLWSEKI